MKIKLRLPDWKAIAGKLGKYRYAVLIAMVGLALLLWPTSSSEPEENSEPPPTMAASDLSNTTLEEKLESAISQIDGAGKVSLILSWSDDGEVVYQTDTTASSADDSASSERSTVTVQTGSSQYCALVVQTRSPTCLGALVVCEGADSAGVRLQIVEAVAALTGLGADQISVVKMKS